MIYKTQASRKYYLLSCHRFMTYIGHKSYEETIILSVINDGGSICFTFTDLSNNEVISLDNPKSGDYIIPLKKGIKTKLVITASKAIGSYKIIKKTIIDK